MCHYQVVAREMVQRGKGGSIVNVSSNASTLALVAGISAYCASKGAVDSLTQAMALELGPHKVTVKPELQCFYRAWKI